MKIKTNASSFSFFRLAVSVTLLVACLVPTSTATSQIVSSPVVGFAPAPMISSPAALGLDGMYPGPSDDPSESIESGGEEPIIDEEDSVTIYIPVGPRQKEHRTPQVAQLRPAPLRPLTHSIRPVHSTPLIPKPNKTFETLKVTKQPRTFESRGRTDRRERTYPPLRSGIGGRKPSSGLGSSAIGRSGVTGVSSGSGVISTATIPLTVAAITAVLDTEEYSTAAWGAFRISKRAKYESLVIMPLNIELRSSPNQGSRVFNQGVLRTDDGENTRWSEMWSADDKVNVKVLSAKGNHKLIYYEGLGDLQKSFLGWVDFPPPSPPFGFKWPGFGDHLDQLRGVPVTMPVPARG